MKGKVAGIDTNTLLLIGGGAVVVYLLTRKPAAPPVPPVYTPVYTSGSQLPSAGGAGNTTGQYIALGTSLINSLDNFF